MNHIHDTIEQILSLGPARRGQLSEQFLKGRRKDGSEVLRGPYYVLQWYEGGRKMSARVPKDQVPRVREELARGKRVEAMLRDAEEALWKRLANEGDWGSELRALETAGFLKKDGFDLKSFEEAVRDAVRRTGLRYLSVFLNEDLPALAGLERLAGSKGKRSRQVGTSLGEVTLRRAYVPGKGCPLDEALGLVEGFTPEAASMLCEAGAMSGSYDRGEASLKKLSGLAVPGRSGWSTPSRRRWRRRWRTARSRPSGTGPPWSTARST